MLTERRFTRSTGREKENAWVERGREGCSFDHMEGKASFESDIWGKPKRDEEASHANIRESLSARATVSAKIPEALEQLTLNLVAYNDRHVFSHSSRCQKSEISITKAGPSCWQGHTPSGSPREESIPWLWPPLSNLRGQYLGTVSALSASSSPLCVVGSPSALFLQVYVIACGDHRIIQESLPISRLLT